MPKRVIVIGGGVGGLSAAINCRLYGYDVLLVEAHRVGGKAAGIEIGGYRLDPGPSIVILPEIYGELFGRAGVSMADRLRLDRLDPLARVYFEGLSEPIDLPADRRTCLEAVARFAPEDAAAFEGLMARLDRAAPHIEKSIFRRPYHQLWQLADPHLMAVGLMFGGAGSYKQEVDRLFKSPLLRAFFYGFPSYGGQTYLGRAWGAFLIPYYMIQGGVYYPWRTAHPNPEGVVSNSPGLPLPRLPWVAIATDPGGQGQPPSPATDGFRGVAAIPEALADLARELGVEIREETPVTGLETEGNRVSGVRLAGGKVDHADAVISNVDRSTTRIWLGIRTQARSSFSYFTIHWGIRRKLDGLAHHTLLVPRSFQGGFEQLYRHRQMPDEPIVYVNAPSVTDPTTAPEGCTNLFAVVTAPACEDGLDWVHLAVAARQRVLEALGHFGWEFTESDFDFERIQTPSYFESEHGNYRGSLYGVDEADRLFGMFPERCADEQFRNLFYCGASVQPGAGLPMVTLSGRFAAELVRGRLR